MLGVVASVCTHPRLSTIRKKKQWTDNCSWKKVERSSLCINVFAFRRLIRHCYYTFQIVKFFFSKCYALHNDFYLHDSKVNFDNRSKKRKKEQHSRARFWSSDLWVMGPARFHCATLLTDRNRQVKISFFNHTFSAIKVYSSINYNNNNTFTTFY